MITLHFHLQPQYKYESFHINFTKPQNAGNFKLFSHRVLTTAKKAQNLEPHCKLSFSNSAHLLVSSCLILYIVPKLNWTCTRGEIVVFSWGLRSQAASQWQLKVMLRAKDKTRQLLCGSSGDQKTPTSQVWRAGGYELIRQRHFDHIHSGRRQNMLGSVPLGGTRVSTCTCNTVIYRIIERTSRLKQCFV